MERVMKRNKKNKFDFLIYPILKKEKEKKKIYEKL